MNPAKPFQRYFTVTTTENEYWLAADSALEAKEKVRQSPRFKGQIVSAREYTPAWAEPFVELELRKFRKMARNFPEQSPQNEMPLALRIILWLIASAILISAFAWA